MTRTTVFISSVSRDRLWRDRLASQLTVLARQNLIDLWDDSAITPGELRRDAIDKHLSQARVAILLISADFLGSSFIMDEQIPALLGRHESDGMVIYPLLVRACPWKAVPWLAARTLRPLDGKPLAASRAKVDHLLSSVAMDIAGIVEVQASEQRLQGALNRHEARLTSISEQLQHFALRETTARSEAFLNLHVSVKVLQYRTREAVRSVMLETRVMLENKGGDMLALAALYVSVRAFDHEKPGFSGTVQPNGTVSTHSQGDILETSYRLTPRENLAVLRDTTLQLAPDEIEEFVHWTILDETLASTLGVVVVCIDAFTASGDLIGVKYLPDRRVMPLRDAWLKYLDETPRRYCIFGRIMGDSRGSDGPNPRVLLKHRESSELSVGEPELVIDEENTAQFRELLDTLIEWHRYHVVPLTENNLQHRYSGQ